MKQESRSQAQRLAVLGAPTNLGLKPYDDTGLPRQLHRAPAVYRQLGVVERLGAIDLGDVPAPAYRDLEAPRGGVRNESELVGYSHALAGRVAAALDDGLLPVVLGGDCSIVLGNLLGARRHGRGGLAYVDAHCDFALPSFSVSAAAAGMDLALALGRGESPLARLDPAGPLLREEDAVVLGRKDEWEEEFYGEHSLRRTAVLDLPWPAVQERGAAASAAAALERLARPELAGFWVHFDVDVLDPVLMPAVDTPEEGGPDLAGLAALLAPLVRHPRALGLQVTIYDPGLDPDLACGERIVGLLEELFAAD